MNLKFKIVSMLDKLFKYISENKVQLDKDSCESCINGFLNDKKCRKHYKKGPVTWLDRFEDTIPHNRKKFQDYFNKLIKSGEVIYDWACGMKFKGTYDGDKLDFDFCIIKFRGYEFQYNSSNADPIEFLNRLKWIILNYDDVYAKAKVYSFNLFHGNDEVPAISISNDGELNIVDPLEDESPVMKSAMDKIFDEINGR